MSGVGLQDNLGQTSDFTISRDKLIRLAFQTIGVVAPGEQMSANELEEGKDRLNLIIREIDESGKWRWTVQTAIHVPLIGGVGVYDGNVGLPTNISELQSVVYRSAKGSDSRPLRILTAEEYERIENKLEPGEPACVYLTEDRDVTRRRLYIWPIPTMVTAQSKVIGTDDAIYRCIYPHTASTLNTPTTGANWRMVWEVGSGAATVWAAGVAYTMAESLRIVAKRPIFDFDEAEHIPDFPPQFQRLLVYRLASDLADAYPAPMEERTLMAAKIKGAYSDIFASTKPKTTEIHHKALYF